jgi:hypothetical protein
VAGRFVDAATQDDGPAGPHRNGATNRGASSVSAGST